MSAKILIIDSNSAERGAYSSILESKGCQLSTCSSNEEAYLYVRTRKPDLMLLEQGQGRRGMPSDELCRTIKNDPALNDIVIFILSSENDFETKLEYFALGADDFLVRPIDPREVAARIVHFLHLVSEWGARWKRTSSDTLKSSQERSSPEHHVLPVEQAEDSKPKKSTPQQYGPYRVDSLAGQGGMGRVYRGWDVVLERPVAIKVLSPSMSRSVRDAHRFRREAKLLASISHPGIARIYRFGEQNGEYYFIMEWCSGGSLADLIRKRRRIQILTALEIVIQCAHALNAAVLKGVVHRDIKPRNIMIGDNQEIRIVDFGLAKGATKKQSGELTGGGEIFGSPRYMAPEQALSVDVDHRADIYSLGIVFYEMIYGKPPYQSANAIELVLKHAKEPFPPYASLGGKIPARLYEIIQKMAQKLPKDRYQSYNELIDDLEKVKTELFQDFHLAIPVSLHKKDVPSVRGRSLFEVLTAVFKQSLSGVLTLSFGPDQKTLLIRNNEVVSFQSAETKHEIWDALIGKGLIKKGMKFHSDDFETVLNTCLAEEIFTLKQFREAYRGYMREKILALFASPNQQVAFTEADIMNDALGSLMLGDLLLEVTRTRIEVKNFELHSIQTSLFHPVRDFQKVFHSLTFTPEESFMASRFEGQSLSVNKLCQITGISDERVLRFVYALHKMGYLES